MSLSITWLGHSTFILQLASGQRIVTDPWLGNPQCPPAFAKPDSLKPVDLILVTHGHSDHATDAVSVSRATGAPVACLFELGQFLDRQGLQQVKGMGIGGTQVIDSISLTMTQAIHSGSTVVDGQIVYLGGAAGFIIRAPGTPIIYFAGDTALFGDMKIIGELYRPEIGFLPIGDHFTMGPDTAAIAAQWLGVRQVVPMHWGTFPLLRGTPAALKAELSHTTIDVLDLKPGQTAE